MTFLPILFAGYISESKKVGGGGGGGGKKFFYFLKNLGGKKIF
jgi:hypothetical protein